jgi:hypothetical protein
MHKIKTLKICSLCEMNKEGFLEQHTRLNGGKETSHDIKGRISEMIVYVEAQLYGMELQDFI